MEVKALLLLLAVGLGSSAVLVQDAKEGHGENLAEETDAVELQNIQSGSEQSKGVCGCFIGETCCQYTNGWGCCPLKNAVCCRGYKCCASEYKCGATKCEKKKDLYPFIVEETS